MNGVVVVVFTEEWTSALAGTHRPALAVISWFPNRCRHATRRNSPKSSPRSHPLIMRERGRETERERDIGNERERQRNRERDFGNEREAEKQRDTLIMTDIQINTVKL